MNILLNNIQIGDILIDSYGESFCIVLTERVTISTDILSQHMFDLDDTSYWDKIVDNLPLKGELLA